MCSSPPSLMEIPTVVITPSTPNFGGMPFERDDKHSQHPGAAEKLYGLGFSMGSAASPVQSLLPGQTIRSRRQSSRYQGLALSLSVITLFILVLVLPTVSLRNIVSDSVSRDVDALKTFAGFGGASLADMYVPEEGENAVVDDTEPALSKRDETSQPYRPAFGPGQGRRSVATAIEQAKRQDALQRRSAAAWRASALDDAIAAKLADLHGPGGVGAAAVYISQDHYDEDSQLYKRSSPSVGESVEGDAEVVAQAQTEAEELLAESEEGAEEVLGAPNSYNLPAAPKAPWSLENEINAKQKEAGRLASS